MQPTYDCHDILKEYWGYDSFRPLQHEIIDSVLQGRDTLGLMPTGGGKSLTFQVPAMALDGICLVITPLIALMKDQVANLTARNIKAVAVYSGMPYQEVERLLDNCVYGDYKFLYLSPERLATSIFLNRWPHLRVSLIVVDEAHCISQWGYDFRPSYLRIADIRAQKPDVSVLALTATATPEVVKDIQYRLSFRSPNVFRTSFARPNLSYVVRTMEDKQGTLVEILNKVPGSSVVYVRNRKKSKEVAEYLQQCGYTAQYFHAGLTNAEKDERQQKWKANETRIIVATNAFGMGIDKPDVRSVIHLDLPDTLEAYFQEAGRAGRDGHTAYAILLYNGGDTAKAKKRIADNYPPKKNIRSVYDSLCNYYQIALGSGCDHVFPFDLADFCASYKLSLITTYNALKILQIAGVIELTDEQDTDARVFITFDRDALYSLDLPPLDERVLEVLLRSYTGLFADMVYIDEGLLAQRANCTLKQVKQILVNLAQRHILRYIPARHTPYICFTCERLRPDLVDLGKEVYDIRQERFVRKVTTMMRYAEQSEECRSRFLLAYFGETNGQPCNRCDVCLQKKKHRPLSGAKQKETIERLKASLQNSSCTLNELVTATELPNEPAIELIRSLMDDGYIVPTANMRYSWKGKYKP